MSKAIFVDINNYVKAPIKGNPRGKPVIKRKPHRLLFEGNQASATDLVLAASLFSTCLKLFSSNFSVYSFSFSLVFVLTRGNAIAKQTETGAAQVGSINQIEEDISHSKEPITTS